MRRQVGAWAAPIASWSAGLRFQVAIVEGRFIASSRWEGKLTTDADAFWSPGLDQQRPRDHRAEGDHADGDRGEHAVEAEAEPLDRQPAAHRRDGHAHHAAQTRRLHAADALPC